VGVKVEKRRESGHTGARPGCNFNATSVL